MTSRGLLDWPGVVLGAINQPLVAVLPEPVVLAFWALRFRRSSRITTASSAG